MYTISIAMLLAVRLMVLELPSRQSLIQSDMSGSPLAYPNFDATPYYCQKQTNDNTHTYIVLLCIYIYNTYTIYIYIHIYIYEHPTKLSEY